MLDSLINEFKKELTDTITESIKLQLNELNNNFHSKESDIYLTRKETAKMLSIDLSTLHLWTKKGQLLSRGIGNRVYYKRSDIEKSMIKLKK